MPFLLISFLLKSSSFWFFSEAKDTVIHDCMKILPLRFLMQFRAKLDLKNWTRQLLLFLKKTIFFTFPKLPIKFTSSFAF